MNVFSPLRSFAARTLSPFSTCFPAALLPDKSSPIPHFPRLSFIFPFPRRGAFLSLLSNITRRIFRVRSFPYSFFLILLSPLLSPGTFCSSATFHFYFASNPTLNFFLPVVPRSCLLSPLHPHFSIYHSARCVSLGFPFPLSTRAPCIFLQFDSRTSVSLNAAPLHR